MMHKPFIKKYAIYGLFGYKNLELVFNDSIKILIGENGYGKTTILNSLAYLLKGEYKNLAKIKFERIRRITGYLVGTLDRFNDGKRAEVESRVKHMRKEHCDCNH